MLARYLAEWGMREMLFTRTYIARALQQIETKLDYNVILIPKNLRDAASNPSAT